MSTHLCLTLKGVIARGKQRFDASNLRKGDHGPQTLRATRQSTTRLPAAALQSPGRPRSERRPGSRLSFPAALAPQPAADTAMPPRSPPGRPARCSRRSRPTRSAHRPTRAVARRRDRAPPKGARFRQLRAGTRPRRSDPSRPGRTHAAYRCDDSGLPRFGSSRLRRSTRTSTPSRPTIGSRRPLRGMGGDEASGAILEQLGTARAWKTSSVA